MAMAVVREALCVFVLRVHPLEPLMPPAAVVVRVAVAVAVAAPRVGIAPREAGGYSEIRRVDRRREMREGGRARRCAHACCSFFPAILHIGQLAIASYHWSLRYDENDGCMKR